MLLSRFIICGCLLALCAGCGRQPRINQLSEDSVVVAFGDSLTQGTGARPPESYPAVLAELIESRVVNAGVSGENTTEGLARLPAVLAKELPDLVILCHGGNDMLRGQDRDAMRANLSAMVDMAREAGADVILIGVPQPGLRFRPPPLYREVAAQYGIPLDIKILPRIVTTPALKSDHVHPNAEGYRQLAEAVAALIKECQAE